MRTKKSRNLSRTLTIIVFLLWFVIAFRNEILSILALLYSVIRLLIGNPIPFPSGGQVFRAAIILAGGLITFLLFIWIGLYLLSQFVLPVKNEQERSEVFERMSNFIFGVHGPALFIKEGKVIGKQAEMHRLMPGIIFVDHCSVAVLERQPSPSVLSYWKRRIRNWFRRKPAKPGPVVRVIGPGIAFTHGGEKLRGAVDMRPQTRRVEKITAHTRDGIPVETNVMTSFTLGEEPDVITVTANPDKPNRILVVRCESSGQGLHISELYDELDEVDQAEIYFSVQEMTRANDYAERHEQKRRMMEQSPYIYSNNRILSAIYSAEARQMPDNTLEVWSNLPVQVAVEVFRNMLAAHVYDFLYLPEDPKEYPIQKLKRNFSRTMVYQGVVSYQYIERLDGQPIPVDTYVDLQDDEVLYYPVRQLHSPKTLRNRGIKVLNASFSNLEPKSKTIRDQFLETWKARWQSEADIANADFELQAMRIKNRARVQAQQEMTYILSHLFEMPSYSQEALAMRVFQALETAATEPSTHQLLPQDTVNLLHTLRNLMIPDEDHHPKPNPPENPDPKDNQTGAG